MGALAWPFGPCGSDDVGRGRTEPDASPTRALSQIERCLVAAGGTSATRRNELEHFFEIRNRGDASAPGAEFSQDFRTFVKMRTA